MTSGVSPDGRYVVTCQSRIDQVPVSQLLDRNGHVLLNLEEADLSRLPDGWQWPEPVKLTAADGKTAIYGALFKPSDFSANKQYPVIDGSLCSPELYLTPKGLLSNDNSYGCFFLHAAALSELGFIVVLIDGRGSACRNKAFVDHSYGCLPEANSTDDRITGIKQLGEKRSYMDLDRVGFMDFGSDGGTLMRYPGFYKVSVCFAVMDARLMAAAFWGEQFEGENCATTDEKRTEQLVSNLQGKLLLIHGLLDPLDPPACAFRLVEALHQANKNFDMLMLPNHGHPTFISPYAVRRTWDYFVKHLQGLEPPKEFQLALPSN
jgi:dipeptidyl aminopeptidase/acylaminoacyl peptidase